MRQVSTPSSLDPAVAARLKRDGDGLVCAVVQQYDSAEVLMVGWMDDEALHRTLTSGRVTFWSRSRQEYWRKGDTSGHAQLVKQVALDCDGDALLVRVDQVGVACHTGELLMVGWMDDEALHRTLTTGRCTYWSRSRREYWVKGETSGHHQYVRGVALDCDGDALLVTVDQVGAACHTGSHSCFTDELPVAS